MKKQAYTGIAMIVLLGCLAVSAKAQCSSGSKWTAEIPFQFSTGRTTLPAGEYIVTCMSPELLLIRSPDGKGSATMLMISVSGKAQDRAKLVFRRYRSRYFFGQVWTGRSDAGLELPATPAERAVARTFAGIKPKNETVAMSHRR